MEEQEERGRQQGEAGQDPGGKEDAAEAEEKARGGARGKAKYARGVQVQKRDGQAARARHRQARKEEAVRKVLEPRVATEN